MIPNRGKLDNSGADFCANQWNALYQVKLQSLVKLMMNLIFGVKIFFITYTTHPVVHSRSLDINQSITPSMNSVSQSLILF